MRTVEIGGKTGQTDNNRDNWVRGLVSRRLRASEKKGVGHQGERGNKTRVVGARIVSPSAIARLPYFILRGRLGQWVGGAGLN